MGREVEGGSEDEDMTELMDGIREAAEGTRREIGHSVKF